MHRPHHLTFDMAANVRCALEPPRSSSATAVPREDPVSMPRGGVKSIN